MAKCRKCGRSGLMIKTDSRGICSDCNETLHAQRIEELKRQKSELQQQIDQMTFQLRFQQDENASLLSQHAELERKINLLNTNISGLQSMYDGIRHAIRTFYDRYRTNFVSKIKNESDIEPVIARTRPDISRMSAGELKKLFQRIAGDISLLISTDRHFYEDTPSSMAIYNLVELGLQAEINTVLSHLYLWDVQGAVDRVKLLTKKYCSMATLQNPSFAPQMKKTIGQLEYFYIQAVTIAHEFYQKKARLNPSSPFTRDALNRRYHEGLFLLDISSSDPFRDELPVDPFGGEHHLR